MYLQAAEFSPAVVAAPHKHKQSDVAPVRPNEPILRRLLVLTGLHGGDNPGGGNGFFGFRNGNFQNGLVSVTYELEDTFCNPAGGVSRP